MSARRPVKSMDYRYKKVSVAAGKKESMVQTFLFNREIAIFDKELSEELPAHIRTRIIELAHKKCADRIIKDRWRMPIPSGMGHIYLKQVMVTSRGKKSLWTANTDAKKAALLREIKTGLSGIKLRHNKIGVLYRHKNIYNFSMNQGHFFYTLRNEIMECAMDATKPKYKGHII